MVYWKPGTGVKANKSMNTKPRLVSFKLCPFVQKAVILLREKQIDYDIEYIDLAAPPDWFLRISPHQKVPVLILGDDIIFESSVILEYLDEAYPPQLHPVDLIAKARNRSWIEFSSTCLFDLMNLTIAETEKDFEETISSQQAHLDQVENVKTDALFFNGNSFSLVDVSYAPLFDRLEQLQAIYAGVFDPNRHPRLNHWKQQLLSHPSVQGSTVPTFNRLYQQFIWKRQGYISRFMDDGLFDPVDEKSVY